MYQSYGLYEFLHDHLYVHLIRKCYDIKNHLCKYLKNLTVYTCIFKLDSLKSIFSQVYEIQVLKSILVNERMQDTFILLVVSSGNQ